MDADVALKDFTDVPYVIERPADGDAVADAAFALLAKAGLRISFGKAAEKADAHDALVRDSLPDGVGYVPRRGVRGACASSVAVVGPRDDGTENAFSMAYRTWNMAGHAAMGTDRARSAAFAAFMAVRHGAWPFLASA